jgi:hypothetical protein
MGFLRKCASVPEPVSQEFHQTIWSTIPLLFPKGWDRKYEDYAHRAYISRKASFEVKLGAGGAARAAADHCMGRHEFLSLVMTGASIPPTRRVSIVSKDGKQRIVTVASYLQHQLLPLHLLMYDHLSRKDWILRGDAKGSKFSSFVRKKDEVFVSGDYEDATNNFQSVVSREVLKAILFHAYHVPEGIKAAAMDSLTGFLSYSPCGNQAMATTFPQNNGQMMGNFLSFPLLCVVNYLGVVHAFGYARTNSIPLKINGDDIVFRSTRSEAELWFTKVREAGLVLSKGKTLVQPFYFSLNSRFFVACDRRAKELSVLRPHTMFRAFEADEGFDSIAGRMRQATRTFGGAFRRKIMTAMMKFHRKKLRTVPCSLNRGLRIRVPFEVLCDTGMLQREIDNLSRPEIVDVLQPEEASIEFRTVQKYGFVKKATDVVCRYCQKYQSRLFHECGIRERFDEERKRREEEIGVSSVNGVTVPALRSVVVQGLERESCLSLGSNWVSRLARGRRLMGMPSRLYKRWRQVVTPPGVYSWIYGRGKRVARGSPTMYVVREQLCFRCEPVPWYLVVSVMGRGFGGGIDFCAATVS